MKVKRYSVLLAMRSLNLFIGWILFALLQYLIISWIFEVEGIFLWIGVFIISYFFSYYSLLKQLFISDQVMFEENRLSIKRNGVWSYNEYQNIRDIMFYSQNVRGTVYPILSFIDQDGRSQQIIFLNEKQFESIKEFMVHKNIITQK